MFLFSCFILKPLCMTYYVEILLFKTMLIFFSFLVLSLADIFFLPVVGCESDLAE